MKKKIVYQWNNYLLIYIEKDPIESCKNEYIYDMNYPFFDDEPKVFDAFERILFSLHLYVILL